MDQGQKRGFKQDVRAVSYKRLQNQAQQATESALLVLRWAVAPTYIRASQLQVFC